MANGGRKCRPITNRNGASGRAGVAIGGSSMRGIDVQRSELLLIFAGALLLALWRSRALPALALPPALPAPVPSVSTSEQWYDYTTGTWRDF